MVPQGPQGDPAAHQDLGRVGHEHLATVGEGHQPRRSVHLCAVVVAVALDGLARVQRHPDGERRWRSSPPSSRWDSTAAVTASTADENAAQKPSPR